MAIFDNTDSDMVVLEDELGNQPWATRWFSLGREVDPASVECDFGDEDDYPGVVVFSWRYRDDVQATPAAFKRHRGR